MVGGGGVAGGSLVVLVLCLLVPAVRAHLTQSLLERLSQYQEGEGEGVCDVSDIGEVVSCSGPLQRGGGGGRAWLLAPGEACLVGTADPPHRVLRCQENGLWLEEGKRSALSTGNSTRERRALPWLGAILGADIIGVALLVASEELVNTRPDIDCPRDLIKMADRGGNSAKVWWNSPTATDLQDGDLTSKVRRIHGPAPGSLLSEGRHSVQYKVADSRGDTAYCSLRVTVRVVRCPMLSNPSAGVVSCTEGSVFGSECSVSCEPGYQASGTPSLSCGKDGKWSPGTLACKKKSCPPPPSVARGHYECPDGRQFQDTCSLTCDSGFIPLGIPIIECLSDHTWSSGGHCKDDIPPKFVGCPRDQEAVAGAGSLSALVTWTMPAVMDNSGEARITLETHKPGSSFSQGQTRVVYRAEDLAKNVASCTFLVTVRVLECAAPDFDKSNRSLMLVQGCSHRFSYGSTCTVACRDGFPHLGAKTITCEADLQAEPPRTFWKADGGQAPQCKVYPCTPLQPPAQGTLSCDSWGLGRLCSTRCQQGHDVPRQLANGAVYACAMNQGTWRPSNTVPDCNRERTPDYLRLPGSVHYYSSECPDNRTQSQLQQQFFQIVQIHPVYAAECQNSSVCGTKEASAQCGPVSTRPPLLARRTRAAEDQSRTVETTSVLPAADVEVQLDFDMTLPFTPDFEARKERLLDALLASLARGTFDLFLDYRTFQAGDVSLDYVDPVCPNGSIYNADVGSEKCAGCAPGTYYSEDADECLACPIGHYGDEGFLVACKRCPANTSTVEEGAKSANSCIPACQAGQQSPTGLAPCSDCPLATFQPEQAQTSCLPCPANHSTPSPGSTSNSSCLTLLACEESADAEEEEPCGSHRCSNELGGFQCSCRGGWSGPRCQTPPDPCLQAPCQHNGSCVSEGLLFLCTCRPGYFGDLCQQAVVDGEWGEWASWGDCSVSCGGGVRSRQRLCDAPPPSPQGGQPCNGSASQQENCSPQPCPVCEPLEQPRGVEFQCREEGEGGQTLSCTASCRAGLVFARQPAPSYLCGPATNHTWSHRLPDSTGTVPSCSSVEAPSSMTLTSTSRHIPCDVSEGSDVSGQVTSGVSRLECAARGLCQARVRVGGCPPKGHRDRRSLPTPNATLEVTLTAEMKEEELDFVQFFENNTMTEAVKHYVDSLVALAKSGEALNNNTDDVLTVEVNGEVFAPEPGSASLTGSKTCGPGKVPVESFCSPCPEGSRQVGADCLPCGRGSYQHQPAQTSCLPCPPWHHTPLPGASSPEQCLLRCPPGKRQEEGGCRECPGGSYQDQEGQRACKLCPPGLPSSQPGASSPLHCSGGGARLQSAHRWAAILTWLCLLWHHVL